VSDKLLPLEHSHVHTVVIVFQLGDFSSMSAHLPSPLKAHGGHDEEALLRAQLSDKWGKFRACSCFIGTAASFIFCPCGLAYLLCGGSCREEEQRSFELVLTPTALNYAQKTYGSGFCCQTTVKKSIPLDKIQDIALVADCCGDFCGYAAPGEPYILQVQTAGFSGPGGAELVVFCLAQPQAFRTAVLAAKRALSDGRPPAAASGALTGAPKFAAGGGGGGGVSDAGVAAIVTVLERLEAAVNEGLRELRESRAPPPPPVQ